jgi:hypothetical protein
MKLYEPNEYIKLIVDDIKIKKEQGVNFDSIVLISCLSANNYKNDKRILDGKNPMESLNKAIKQELGDDVPVFAPNKIISTSYSKEGNFITLEFNLTTHRENNNMGRLKSTLNM